ncbi:MAG: hypothetical protein KatS3mg111_2601 [Pirellulaceae bacterium]|nr:MAG: hypothetical protein KatS3mg111_2601 [Pirellulaceae bacterium]
MKADATVELSELIGLFYPNPDLLGEFTVCSAQECPQPYRELLHHNAHMTVTVERHHGGPVDVQVLEAKQVDNRYARRIVLRRQSDHHIVQFGIVRMRLDAVKDKVQEEILSQKIPLGRVLIQNNVLREVKLANLWKVGCGADLAHVFSVAPGDITYGRTAMIYCDGEPTVELLEIVAPETTF